MASVVVAASSDSTPLLLALVAPDAVTVGQPCWVKSNDDSSESSGGRLAGCAFGGGVSLDTLLPRGLKEASGVSASGKYPGRLYTVDDGGALYTLDATNNSDAVRLQFTTGGSDGVLTASSESDWEDVAVAREPLAPRRWKVFVGDVGNNEGQRRTVRVFKFEEPPPSLGGEDILVDRFDTIQLEYPKDAKAADEGGGGDTEGGGWPDAETLIVDPQSGDIFLITKDKKEKVKQGKGKKGKGKKGIQQQTETGARVYRARYPYSTQRKNRLEFAGQLGFPGEVVGGDVTQTGNELLLKTLKEVLYFSRGTQTVKPQPYVREAQGEAVGFAADGSGFYTLSERGKKKKKNSGIEPPPNALTFHQRMRNL